MEGTAACAMETNNPDFDDLYPKVETWLIELDEETSVANREIGLDSKKEPIVLAPWGCNFGLWVDSVVNLKQIAYEELTEEEFEMKWIKIEEELAR